MLAYSQTVNSTNYSQTVDNTSSLTNNW